MPKVYHKKNKDLIKRPVSISLNCNQIERIEQRCAQTQLNRSKQIQRDLSLYWMLLDMGLKEAQRLLTVEDVKLLLEIFKGKVPDPQDDLIWARENLVNCVRSSSKYVPDAALSIQLAHKISRLSYLARLGIMDWLHRGSVNTQDESLFANWKKEA